MASEGYKGEDGDAVVDFNEMISRVRWGLAPRPRPAPPMMATGFVALATRRVLPLPFPSRPTFGSTLPRMSPWIGSTGASAASSSAVSPASAQAVREGSKRRRVASAPSGSGDPDDELRALALGEWRKLVRGMGSASTLFVQMGGDESVADATFMAAFYGKPGSTLMKRAVALRLYERWAATAGLDPWPLKEAQVFQYLRFLVSERAPPTRGQSFREALGFARGFVGLAGVEDVLGSRRVAGSVQEGLDRREIRRQRPPLTASMVMRLEAFMVDASREQRVVAGFVLFCLHGRARVGDALRADVEPKLDIPEASSTFGFVEGGLLKHKTSFRNRSMLRLPVVADAFGVSQQPWAQLWLAARASLGLSATTDRFLLPSVLGSMEAPSFGQGRATTDEVTVLIRDLLRLVDPTAVVDDYGSHSLKPTLLSWCAKFGVPLAARRRLGGHAKSREKAVVAYSRDELSEPLRRLQEVLAAVRNQSFDPDASRSGLLRAGAGDGSAEAAGDDPVVGDGDVDEAAVTAAIPGFPDGDAPQVPPPVLDESFEDIFGEEAVDPVRLPLASGGGDAEDPEATPCMVSPCSPSSSSSSSSSTSDSDGFNSSLDEAEHIVNPKSGVFHLKHEVEPGRLRCGRRLRGTFRSADFTAAYALEAHRCRKCHP